MWHSDYLPVNQYNVLRENLPDAKLVFTQGFLHELLSIHSTEELDCVRKAGVLCRNAMDAMVARACPGVKEYELRAAAGAARRLRTARRNRPSRPEATTRAAGCRAVAQPGCRRSRP